MKVLLLGSSGQLGSSIKRDLLKKKNIKVSIYDKNKKKNYINYSKSNITKIIFSEKPNIVINAIAFTNVDLAEVQKEKCYKVNVTAVNKIAKSCKRINAKLIHFSTEYVYGNKKKFYIKENNRKNPINYYSKTKLLSEKIIKKNKCDYVIFRIAWVYNINKNNNFIKKIIIKILSKKDFSVVDDQFGHPTSAQFISQFLTRNLLKIYKLKGKQTYNLCPSGYASRYYVANFILKFLKKKKLLNKNIKIFRTKTRRLNKLPRQFNSVLCNYKIKKDFNVKFDSWKLYLEKILKKHYAD